MNRREFLATPAALSAGSPLRWGIIGAGNRGRRHIEFIRALGARGEVHALADVDEEQIAQALKLAPQAKAYGDYRKLLEDRSVDTVLVASPNFLHREHATAALASGRHVLCEKPLATTVEDARAILEAARRAKTAFLAGHELRFAPVYVKVREIMSRIGRVCGIIHTELRGDWNPRGWRYNGVNWRFLQRPSGGTLVEKSCHFTDLYFLVTGQNPLRAVCSGGVQFYKDGRETMDHATLALEYPGGVTATHVLSMYHRPMLDEFRIMGTEGVFVINHHRTLDWIAYGKKPQREPVAAAQQGVARHSGDLEMHEAFYRAAAEGAALPFAMEFAADAVKTCLMGEQAAKERRYVQW